MSLQIERLEFRPWGCFGDLALAFAATPGVVELIYGPNAAGKSTLRRGERSLLYGIEAQTPDSHTFQYADLRIGARLRFDGTSIDVVRRKGRTATLLDADGNALPDETIGRELGGLSEDVYRALFQITHETLVQGAAELLQGRGEVGASLFAAASGVASLHRTLSGFDLQADSTFRPRGRTDPLHRALTELQAAQKRLRDSTLRPARHADLVRALHQAESVCKDLSAEVRALTVHAGGIERRRSIVPLLATHAELSAELTALGGTPDLAPDAPERRGSAQTRLRGAADSLERAQSAVEQLEREIERIAVDEPIVSRAAEILELRAAMPGLRKAEAERRNREDELAEARSMLHVAAIAVGVDPHALGAFRRPAAARRALDTCLRQHPELVERHRAAASRVVEAEQELGASRDEVDAAPVPPDVEHVRAALRAAMRLGAIAEEITAARTEQQHLTDDAEASFARLRPSTGELTEFGRMPAPSRAAVIVAVENDEALRWAGVALTAESGRLDREREEIAAEHMELQLIGNAPTAEALSAVRSERDAHWTEIRAAIQGDQDPEARTVDQFDRAIVAADVVADTRTASARQIERAARVEVRARRTDRGARDLAAKELALHNETDQANERWRELWAETGIDPPSLREVLSWLDEREKLLALASSAARSGARASALQDRLDSHARSLRVALEEQGVSIAQDAGLDELTEIGEARVAIAEAQASSRSTAEGAVRRSQFALVQAERDLSEAKAALDDWVRAWPARRHEAGLPDGASPEAAQEIVRAIGDGLAQTEVIAGLGRRLARIDNERKLFNERVIAVCREAALDLASLAPDGAAAALASRLHEASEHAARRRSFAEQLESARARSDEEELELADAGYELSQLLADAGCQSVSELPDVERRSARVRELRSAISSIERQVEQIGEGQFERLRDDAEGVDRDAAAVELATIGERIEELAEERDRRKVEIGEHRQRLVDAEGSVAAVDAAQDVELARAAAAEIAANHARAKLSAGVTRRAMERYRERHEGPLLRRANELFTRFTLGSFVQVFVDHDERAGAVLMGRQHDRKIKAIPQMSDGTREQLFLALRIAAIERYVATSGRIPVIFDDVFLESDVPRSERIFEALGELARSTQVIVLTHHEHLVSLGQKVLAEGVAVQHLPDTVPPLRSAIPEDSAAMAA